MERAKVFVTGINGCIGHYLYDVLSASDRYELYLLVRNLNKLRFDPSANPHVHVINDSLNNIATHADTLADMDAVVHIATCWGGKQAFNINVDKTHALFDLVSQEKCRKIVYFSTASILGEGNEPTPAAEREGTLYVQSKYRAYRELSQHALADRIVTLFPTMVFGGDADHPYSHVTSGLSRVGMYLPLLRFFRVDASFHYIHAYDIARIVRYVLENDTADRDLVLGNPVVTVDYLIDRLCEVNSIRRRFSMDITNGLMKYLPSLLGKSMSSWDRYSLRTRHFVYKTVSTETFGIDSPYRDLQYCLTHV